MSRLAGIFVLFPIIDSYRQSHSFSPRTAFFNNISLNTSTTMAPSRKPLAKPVGQPAASPYRQRVTRASYRVEGK